MLNKTSHRRLASCTSFLLEVRLARSPKAWILQAAQHHRVLPWHQPPALKSSHVCSGTLALPPSAIFIVANASHMIRRDATTFEMDFTPQSRKDQNCVQRLAQRGRYDEEAVFGAVDECPVAHVTFALPEESNDYPCGLQSTF